LDRWIVDANVERLQVLDADSTRGPMSVALRIRDDKDAVQRLVPVAPQEVFEAKWSPGAIELELEWVALMETGFDVSEENRSEVVEELGRLRGWMNLRGEAYEIGRLDRLAAELRALRFHDGATAFVG
jgi:hypothetical protein